jgi:hypothetical protein
MVKHRFQAALPASGASHEPNSSPPRIPTRRKSALAVTFAIVLVLAVAGATALVAQRGGPQPAFGALAASPPNFVFNTPTTVTFTISIDTPTLNPTTVELQRVDSAGNLIAPVGRMFDNGSNGDAKPGDKVFSLRTSINEPAAVQMYYRVSAAFRGLIRQVVSQQVIVEAVLRTNVPGLEVPVPAGLSAVRLPAEDDRLVLSSTPEEFIQGGAIPEDGRTVATDGFSITFGVEDIVEPLDIDAFLDERYGATSINEVTPMTVDGIAAYEFTLRDGIGEGQRRVIVPHPDGSRILIVRYKSAFDADSVAERDGLAQFHNLLATVRWR